MPRQSIPEGWDGRWHTSLPEFACVANAVSLTMPYVEPFVIRSVGATLSVLEPDLAARTRGYLDQETAHQRIHREFNRAVLEHHPGARRVDRATAAVFRWLRRRTSPAFGLAFAAAAEALAYLTARWVSQHQGTLFRGAESWASEMFLWHLAEEVEHKDVARAVYDQLDGSRRRYCLGLITALAVLGTASIAGTSLLLWDQRRLHHPIAWIRLMRWGVGFAFDMLPSLAATISTSHRPADFVDPAWFALYLRDLPEVPGPRMDPDLRR